MTRAFAWIRNFGEDVRFGARQVRRAPGYAVFTVLVLALGIGTVTAMFTVAYAVLLKPLPFAADRNLYQPVEKMVAGDDSQRFSYNEIMEWQRATQGTAEVGFSRGGLNIADGPAGALLITEVDASGNLFPMLGAKPMMGRGFLPEEREAGRADVVVLSYALWQKDFAGDKDVLGQTLHIGGVQRTVIGVMPPQFLYPMWEDRPEAWVPLVRSELAASNRDSYSYFEPLVRVRHGVSVAAVETQLGRAHAQFAKSGNETLRLLRLRDLDLLVANVRPALLALEAAVALVWLIACCNVAGLLLARVVSRRTEIAVRAALGAGRRRILLQFLTESLVLSGVGALGGLGLAAAMLRLFRQMLIEKLPPAANIHLNWAVGTGLLVLTLITALAFGTAPALVAACTGAGLNSGGRRQMADRGQNHLRAALLVGEVALSIALLIGAGLMMRTMYALRHVPLGFRTDHLVVTSLTIPNDQYKNRNVGAAVWQPMLEQIRHMPGVRVAALSTVLPIQHPVELITVVYATQWMNGDASATVRAATPGLTDALGVHITSGRFFTNDDTATSLPVMVVNQTFVNRYLGGGNALGQQIRYGHVSQTATIVGVLEDVHQDGVAEASQPEFYLCMSQLGPQQQIYRALLGRFMQVAVRTETAPGVLIPELRQQIQRANPHLAIGQCTTMAEAVDDSIGAQKLAAQVIGVFAGLVLLITVVGLYGLLSYLVAQRTQEIGVRMALGADRGRVIRMILRQTLIWLGAGGLLGLGLAVAGGRLLEQFLFGVSATDPWTMTLAPLALVVCGVLAAMVPARRAASVNPMDALRAD